MIDFGSHIILDKTETWPDEVLKIINTNKENLQKFLKEERRLDLLSRENISFRLNRPVNIYFPKWSKTIEKIENTLMKYSIVGIHATKLIEDEINDIKENGLKPLNKVFSIKRINNIYKKGLISKEFKNKLINIEETTFNNRKGMVFVFHCLSTLKEEYGLNKLFGYWGGEAIYMHTEQPKKLEKIGTSCIVFVSIKIKELDISPELSKRMLMHYFNDTYYPIDTDSIFYENLNVLRVVRKDDKYFEYLTEIQNWNSQLN